MRRGITAVGDHNHPGELVIAMAIGEIGDRAAQIAAAGSRCQMIDIAGCQRVAERQQLEPVFRAEPRLQVSHDRLRAFQPRRAIAVGQPHAARDVDQDWQQAVVRG